jgi:enoyl-CoA hydratase/carnithine racemase
VSDESPLRVEQRGTVAVWTIDRPDRMNALSRATLLAFGKLAREAVADAGVRAIVITGAGDKAFCAGADLKERQGMTENDVRVQVALYRSELGPLDRSPKPVVAALNGVAYGGGLELALVADLRVAAEHALLALPETTLGIIPGAGGTQRLPRLVGEARTKEMILLGRKLTAHEALAWGLVNRVTPKGTSWTTRSRGSSRSPAARRSRRRRPSRPSTARSTWGSISGWTSRRSATTRSSSARTGARRSRLSPRSESRGSPASDGERGEVC